MKKILCVILVLVMVLSFAGCGERPLAEDAFKGMMTELQLSTVDNLEESMAALGGSTDALGITTDDIAVIIAMYRKVEYTIISCEESEDAKDTEVIEVDITAVDFVSSLVAASEILVEQMDNGTIDVESITEAEFLKLTFEKLGEIISSSSVKTVTTRVTVQYVYTDEVWEMMPSLEFTSALLGGMMG